jgi:hypothetical protein
VVPVAGGQRQPPAALGGVDQGAGAVVAGGVADGGQVGDRPGGRLDGAEGDQVGAGVDRAPAASSPRCQSSRASRTASRVGRGGSPKVAVLRYGPAGVGSHREAAAARGTAGGVVMVVPVSPSSGV